MALWSVFIIAGARNTRVLYRLGSFIRIALITSLGHGCMWCLVDRDTILLFDICYVRLICISPCSATCF